MKKINFDYFFPKDFFKKEINEKFQLFLLNNCIGPFVDEEITWGNADLKQPDLILRDIPIELTLASTEEETTTYIKDIKNHTLQTNNIEELSIKCISNACTKKSKKDYVTSDNIVSILLTIPVFVWCMPYYSNVPELLPPTKFPELLHNIADVYIDNGKFKDVLIHMPGFAYDWLSFSCKERKLIQHRCLNNAEILNKQLPYVCKIGSITSITIKEE